MNISQELLEVSPEDIVSLHFTIDTSSHRIFVLKADQIEEAEKMDGAVFVLPFVKARSGKYMLYPGYPTTDA